MAQKFTLLFVLWIVVALDVSATGTATVTTPTPSTTQVPSTTATTVPSTTATTVPSTTATTVPSTTATTVPSTTATTVPSTTATTVPSTTATTVPSTTAITVPSTTTTTVPSTTATTVPSTTAITVSSTTTTTVPSITATTVPTTTASNLTTTTAGNLTTATAGNLTTATASNLTTATPVTTTTAPTTTVPPDPCIGNTCSQGSTCAPLGDSFLCLCLPGDNYNNDTQRCENAKVFPGQLNLPELTFVESMTNNKSTEFKKASSDINAELLKVFDGPDYSGSIVLKLEPITGSTARSRSEDKVKASIEIIFTANSAITTNKITKDMEKIKDCAGCLFAKSNFTNSDLCLSVPCHLNTTTCNSTDGSFNCTCQKGYFQTPLVDRLCLACPSGQRFEGSDCHNCPFGHSGFNCNESWQLTLVIVGSVLGGLLLITLILLPIMAMKSSKKSSKKNRNAEKGQDIGHYNSHFPTKTPLVNRQASSVNESANGRPPFANGGMTRIPRATSGLDSRTNLEMTPSNSRQNLIPNGRNLRPDNDRDDMNPYTQSRPQSSLYDQARPQSSLYDQARPQNNPYAQNRPQSNPYAQSQGHSNPYYMQDDGRRFN